MNLRLSFVKNKINKIGLQNISLKFTSQRDCQKQKIMALQYLKI